MEPGALIHGWPGLFAAYAAVEAPLLAGMLHARARWRRLALAPLLGAPLTVLAGAAIAALTPALSHLGVASESSVQLSTGVAVSAALGYLSGRALARERASGTVHIRGAIVSAPEARPAVGVGRGASRTRERTRGALTLAGVTLAAEDETKHFKLIGTTGTGKSTAIRELLGAALARGDRAVIADPDGGYLRHFYDGARGDVVLNPFEAASVRWDLFAELTEAQDVEQLARSLIPDHEGPDRSWRGYARTFFSAVTEQARAAGVRDVRELYRLLVVAGTTELRTLVAGTPAQPFLEEHNGRMFDSIRSVTSSAVAALAYVSRQEGGAPFSVRRWARAESGQRDERPRHGVLFIPYRAGEIAALRSVISAWMRLAIFEAMNVPEGEQRLWFVVDELDALGQIDGLKDALARLRKFGGRCVLGFQSVAQVSSTYGAGEAQTLVENCANTLILRCAGSEHGGTSQFASRLIGEREVLRTSVSRSQRALELLPVINRSESSAVEAAVMASEIEQLPDLAGYLKLASRPQWLQVALSRPTPARTSTRPGLHGPEVPRRQLTPAALADRGHEGFGAE
ncbi:MAG TPA: type IV secretion system DNA-binding domain-containing protein [Steroidobacteraceae bacterium]|nr:type IV secretion system DNA-binding domain-containing protein [Steroidobacteraceae bacterium]